MKSVRRTLVLLAGFLSVVAIASAQNTDVRGSKDPPRIPRFKGSVITDYKTSDFGLLELRLSAFNPTGKADTAEGSLVDHKESPNIATDGTVRYTYSGGL